MLPGIGGSEIIVIAVVALLVVGPKDLPKLLRQLGRFVGKMRSMADDFRTSFEDMARQSELDDLRKEVEALRNNRALPGLEDIKSDIDAVGRDIHQTLHATPTSGAIAPVTVDITAEPLMDGLPPQKVTGQTITGQTITGQAITETEIPPVVVKKPRARKTAVVAPTVSEPPKRRSRSKSTVS